METKKPKAKPFTYKPRFGVIVLCKDEKDQERQYAALRKRNLKVRVVSV